MLDASSPGPIIHIGRREDRALLRSNPSARPAAETWPGAVLQGRLPPCFQTPCFGLNAINLRDWAPAQARFFLPPLTGAVRHMSGSSGRGRSRGKPSASGFGATRGAGPKLGKWYHFAPFCAILRSCMGVHKENTKTNWHLSLRWDRPSVYGRGPTRRKNADRVDAVNHPKLAISTSGRA